MGVVVVCPSASRNKVFSLAFCWPTSTELSSSLTAFSSKGFDCLQETQARLTRPSPASKEGKEDSRSFSLFSSRGSSSSVAGKFRKGCFPRVLEGLLTWQWLCLSASDLECCVGSREKSKGDDSTYWLSRPCLWYRDGRSSTARAVPVLPQLARSAKSRWKIVFLRASHWGGVERLACRTDTARGWPLHADVVRSAVGRVGVAQVLTEARLRAEKVFVERVRLLAFWPVCLSLPGAPAEIEGWPFVGMSHLPWSGANTRVTGQTWTVAGLSPPQNQYWSQVPATGKYPFCLGQLSRGWAGWSCGRPVQSMANG